MSTASIDAGLLERNREFVAFDFETTGLSSETDRIVEIGAVRFDKTGAEIGRFQSLVNPLRPMPRAAWSIHGISDEDLVGAPACAEVLPAFLEFLGAAETTVLLAHHAVFDASFLGRELSRIGLQNPLHAVTDTLHLARKRLPNLPNHRLDTLARLFQLDLGDAHRAMADCLRVKGLWLALQGESSMTQGLLAYPILDTRHSAFAPVGWESLVDAIDVGARIRIVYQGGSHGSEPREITPRRIENKGGIDYVVAICHKDGQEKRFRLDRLARHEVLS